MKVDALWEVVRQSDGKARIVMWLTVNCRPVGPRVTVAEGPEEAIQNFADGLLGWDELEGMS